MRKTTKLLTLVLAVLMLVSMATVSAGAAYTDVSVENDALYEAVELLSTLGVAKGTTETTFGPDELVTRQQMAAFTYRLMKAGRSSEGGVNNTPFTDLEDSTYFNMISWANQSGVIKGTSATTFNPKGNITLQDAYTMVVRALGYEKEETLPYPYGYIEVAEEIGLDEDVPSTVDYSDNLTRGDVAIILANAFYADMNEKEIKYDTVTLTDANGNSISEIITKEVNATVASKIFGVKEHTYVVRGTAHYGIGTNATWTDKDAVDQFKGNRYDEDGNIRVSNEVRDFEEFDLAGTSDDYFLAEITLFVQEDEDDAADDKILAATSNLTKKVVTAADITIERSAESDKEYFIGADKDEDQVMTGYINFGGIGAYLDINNAPYSFRVKDENTAVEFVALTGGQYDEDHHKYQYTITNNGYVLAQGSTTPTAVGYTDTFATLSQNGAYDTLDSQFAGQFPGVYYGGNYEVVVYDTDGDNYAEYIEYKPYSFVELTNKKAGSTSRDFGTQDNPSNPAAGAEVIVRENATVTGAEYESGDYALVYLNRAADLLEVKEVIAPIESKLVGKNDGSRDTQTVTLADGTVIEFVDADQKLYNYNSAYTIQNNAFATLGETLTVYVKDGTLLYTGNSSTSEYNPSANYGIVLLYKGAETATTNDDVIVYEGQGVVDGEFTSSFFVNVLVDDTVKAVKLADYVYTTSSVAANGTVTPNAHNIKDVDIDTATKAEALISADFYNKLSTFTVSANGEYVFRQLEVANNTAFDGDTTTEDAIVLYNNAGNVSIANYGGNIYSIANAGLAFNRFYVTADSKIVVKTLDDEGDAVYTLYTADTLPAFTSTTFDDVKAIFTDNTSSTSIENLGYLYVSIPGNGGALGSAPENDYRIFLSSVQELNDKGNTVTYATVLNLDGTTTSKVEVKTGTNPNGDDIVKLDKNGVLTTVVTPGQAYSENVIFEATFVDYDGSFLSVGDGNDYIVNEDTLVLYYKASNNKYEAIAADEVENILVAGLDNTYIDLDEDTVNNLKDSFKVLVVAEEDDDDQNNAAIKVAKSIIVLASSVVDNTP